MFIINYYIKALKNYVNFSGRSQRAEYWSLFLINLIVAFILAGGSMYLSFSSNTSVVASLLYFLHVAYSLFVFLPSLAVSVRRLHDVGQSGWMILIGLIPIIGVIVLLVFFVMDSQEGSNRFGPNPKKGSSNESFRE